MTREKLADKGVVADVDTFAIVGMETMTKDETD